MCIPILSLYVIATFFPHRYGQENGDGGRIDISQDKDICLLQVEVSIRFTFTKYKTSVFVDSVLIKLNDRKSFRYNLWATKTSSHYPLSHFVQARIWGEWKDMLLSLKYYCRLQEVFWPLWGRRGHIRHTAVVFFLFFCLCKTEKIERHLLKSKEWKMSSWNKYFEFDNIASNATRQYSFE